jgi:hypothetical protein
MVQNLRGFRKLLRVPDMPRAKRAKNAKFGNRFLFFAVFARDIPNFGCSLAITATSRWRGQT